MERIPIRSIRRETYQSFAKLESLALHIRLIRCAGNAEAAEGDVKLVQTTKISAVIHTAFQQNGSKVNGEVKARLHTAGIGKLQGARSPVKVPVLSLQASLG